MTSRHASTTRLVVAFAAIYLIWGSTYLAIRFAVETIPPFLMGGTRFGSAGLIVFAWMRSRGARTPTRNEWVAATISGGLMILGGNGLLSWSEQYVPSGLASLLVAAVPIWLVAMGRFGPERLSPTKLEIMGLLFGLAGVVVLITGTGAEIGVGGATEGMVLLASIGVVVASMCWAAGTMYTRRAKLPEPPLYATALTMTAGGALQIIVGLGLGEFGDLDLRAVSARSWWSLVYLTLFGSVVAFSAYAWLLRVVRPAAIGTYAYVNPIVAVFLGWWLAAESFTVPMMFGTVIIVAAVVLVQRGRAN